MMNSNFVFSSSLKRKTNQSKLVRSFLFSIFLACVTANSVSFAAETAANPPPTENKSKVSPDYNSDDKVRNFYQVLEDVLADFEYDLKNGSVQGLKDTAIRNVATSENVPNSFKQHLELLVSERIIQSTKSRLIQCLPCKSKRASLSGNNVVISSPETDQAQLSRIAKNLSIANFMDVAFAYQPSGMIISFYTTDAESGSVVWSRSYNSETSRAAAFRRGVDYSQIDEGRNVTEYEPTLQHRPVIYYLFEADIGGLSGNLGLGYRMMERYDNRRKEVGFEVNYLMNISSLIGSGTTTSTDPTTLYSGLNLTLLFMHAWNLIGDIENYHKPRGSIFAGLGGTYAGGFLGALVRTGYEWRLGKHWAISGNIGYRPSATLFVEGGTDTPISGLEFGIGIGALF